MVLLGRGMFCRVRGAERGLLVSGSFFGLSFLRLRAGWYGRWLVEE